MECLQSRIDSFSKSKRVKKASGTTTLKWPHPASSNSSASSSFKATPATLAEAGFYFDPSVEDPDNVTCFMCQKELGGWEADDDPFQIHYDKCKTRCPWALLRCGLMDDIDRHGRFVFLDKSRLPTSKAMEKARLETFTVGGGWIHDQTRGHGASSKKLAKAGFVHTPQHPGDDLVVCLYCNVSLSGWDEDDDPMEEHRSRKDKSGYPCPFFPSSPPSSDSISPPNNVPSSKTTSKSKPRSTKPPSQAPQYEDIALPTKTHDGDLSGDDGDGDASESAKSTKSTRSSSRKSTATGTSKTPRKPSSSSTRKPSSTGAKTPKARSVSRASSRTGLNNVKEEDEVDEDDEVASEDEVKPKTKKPTKASTAKTPAKAKKSTTVRGRSRSVAPSETEADVLAKGDDAEEETAEPPATVRKGGRTASKAKAVATPAAKKTKSRSKSVARSVRESEGEDEEPDEVVEPPKTAKKPKSKATAPSKKASGRAPVQDESEAGSDVNMEEAWTTAPETERKASKSRKSTKNVKEKKAAVEEETDAFEDAEEDVPRTVKKPSSESKAPTTSKAKPPSKSKPKTVKQAVASESEDEVQAQLEKVEPPTAKKPSRSTSSKPKPAEKENPKSKSAATNPSSSRRAKDETEGETEQETDREAEDVGATDEEDEFGPIIRQPSFTAAAPKKKIDLSAVRVGKGKPSSKVNGKSKSRNEEEDDDEAPEPKEERAMKAKPPSKKTLPTMMNVKFSSGKDGDGDVDMTPLFAPKRAAAPPSSSSSAPSGQSSERGLKPLSQKPANQKKQIQVVDISSDDEEEEQRPTIKLVKPKKSSVPLPFVAPIKESKRDEPVFEEHDEGADDDVMNLDEQREVEMDVMMGDEDNDDEQTLPEPPKTPLRAQAPIFPPFHPTQRPSSSSSLLPPSSSSLQPLQSRSSSSHPEPPQSSEVPEQEPEAPPFFPPLSKLPFMPLPSLTPAELDMSVEEWVRYQMEMEYDKFKRDGERELVRFRCKADDVRKVIEGL